MKNRGLGKGLDSIFGTSTKKHEPVHYKTVAESLKEKSSNVENSASANVEDSANNNSTKNTASVDTNYSVDQDARGNNIGDSVVNETVNKTVGDRINSDTGSATGTNTRSDIKTDISSDIKADKRMLDEAAIDGGDKTKLLKISMIQPNLGQPRKTFDDDELQELANSIKEYGVIQPLIVKKTGPLYEIIAGERRWRASRLAGLKEVPVIIKDIDEKTSHEISIIENIQRSDLNAVEEALAYQSLISEYGLTQNEVAEKVAKKRSTITNSLRLLKLDPETLDMLKSGKLSQGHARALLAIDDEALRKKIAKKCEKEELSVREIETLVKLDKLSKEKKEKKNSPEAEEFKRLKTIYKDLERQMKSNLGTKVSITPKNKERGVVEIEYYSQSDLDRIFLLLKKHQD